MATKKPTVQQTAVKRVIDALHRNGAYSKETAVGYSAFKNISYPTQVIAYTIANLMENGVVKRTEDERYYFSQEDWNKMKKKVNVGYVALIGMPLIVFLIFLAIKYLF